MVTVGMAGAALLVVLLSGCGFLDANRTPVAAFESTPAEGYVSLTVAFDASGSMDPDGDPLTYAWAFGDGIAGAGEQTSHTYGVPGTYSVVLRVRDPEGLEHAVVSTVAVREPPAGTVVLRFGWPWDGRVQRLDFAAPWSLYQMYRGRLRIPFVDNYDYGVYVEDPLDDPTIEDLASDLAARSGQDPVDFAEYVLAFVQGAMAYQPDPPTAEWPLYPLETLVDGGGDCEDTAILYVSLLRARGIGSRIAFVDTDGDGVPDHVIALVAVSSAAGLASGATVFPIDGTLYAVAETASGQLPLGTDPWGLQLTDLMEFWTF